MLADPTNAPPKTRHPPTHTKVICTHQGRCIATGLVLLCCCVWSKFLSFQGWRGVPTPDLLMNCFGLLAPEKMTDSTVRTGHPSSLQVDQL